MCSSGGITLGRTQRTFKLTHPTRPWIPNERGSLLPWGTGPFGYAFHSPVCPRHQAQNSESNCWSSDSNQWMICSNWLIRFSVIGIWPKSLNAPREICKRPTWLQWLCLLKDHQRGSGFSGPIWPWQTTRPTRPVYPVWTKAMEGGLWSMCPLQTARALEEGMPQMPESNGGPSAIDGFAIRRLKGPKAGSGSA